MNVCWVCRSVPGKHDLPWNSIPQRPESASGAASRPLTVRLYGKGEQQSMKRCMAASKRGTNPTQDQNQVFWLTVMVGNLAEKSLAFWATFTATSRASFL